MFKFAVKDVVYMRNSSLIQTLGSVPSDFLVYINDRYLRKTSLNGTKLEDLLVSNYGTVEGFDFDARYSHLSNEIVRLACSHATFKSVLSVC